MAAYASTVTLDMPKVNKMAGGNALGMIMGLCNLTNYNSTRVEITAITGRIKGAPRVIAEGISSNGIGIRWDVASKAFKAYVLTTGAEVANDVNVGSFGFIAVGVAP